MLKRYNGDVQWFLTRVAAVTATLGTITSQHAIDLKRDKTTNKQTNTCRLWMFYIFPGGRAGLQYMRTQGLLRGTMCCVYNNPPRSLVTKGGWVGKETNEPIHVAILAQAICDVKH